MAKKKNITPLRAAKQLHDGGKSTPIDAVSASITASLKPGDKAPEFTAVIEDNKVVSLAQFRGGKCGALFLPQR